MAEQKAPKSEKKKGENERIPSAKKRDLQSEKRRLRTRSYRAGVLTAIRNYTTSIEKKESPEVVKAKLNEVCSLMDKGVKKGVYKLNKAARTKSRLTLRAKS